MRSLQLFLSVDPSLGRIDYSLMSDQALMEMLIEGFDDESKKTYQDSHGMYLDVCEWSGISCDDDERVVEITLDSGSITGSLELCYVPPKVNDLSIRSWGKSELTGSVNLARLPDGMEYVSLCNNRLAGKIDLTCLPDGMQKLSLENNQFTGEIDLTQLPHEMYALYLHDNQLTGEIDLTQLSSEMECLHLHNNQLTGEIDLTHLPGQMQSLYLHNNQLTGSLVIRRLSPSMGFIDMRSNRFSAVAVIDSETDATIKLEGSGVTSVVDGSGRELDMQTFLD